MRIKQPLMMAVTLVAALGASHVFADHDRRTVVRETHYSAPILTYHSGPVSVYVVPSHSTRVITTSQRHDSHGHRYGHKVSGFGHAPHGKAYGYYGRKGRDDHRKYDRYDNKRHYGGSERDYHGGYHGGYYRDHAPSRGSWSRDRREVIYVNKDARRHSNYRRVERNSVVIRERRR
ncbi:hypothetical protein [Pseudohongiella sp.]|uniref:Uncharacterized protein n=1 Tax=marine sediment metagenome TaxID=412755 RepID=A0A0F9VZS6_9ZZZZ|nr:hypothetical protein [Pseudohongiella sp.]HDZ10306.1 hypothetical protein [Pseudohongiella sp.]HEA62071.1 hypothetical protein [Pseudohongiella sp.]